MNRPPALLDVHLLFKISILVTIIKVLCWLLQVRLAIAVVVVAMESEVDGARVLSVLARRSERMECLTDHLKLLGGATVW